MKRFLDLRNGLAQHCRSFGLNERERQYGNKFTVDGIFACIRDSYDRGIRVWRHLGQGDNFADPGVPPAQPVPTVPTVAR